MSGFSIETDFYPSENGAPEERATMADLCVRMGDEVLTRVDDSWAQSVRTSVRVACYPLAMWFAGSWWRQLYETGSSQSEQSQSHGWRMAHEARAAGGGFLWPRITFAPDGEFLEVTSRPSRRRLAEPISFLSDFSGSVPTRAFALEIERFVSSVVARLRARQLRDTELEVLWAQVREELASPALARQRMLEAELGFDPDEGPDALLKGFEELEAQTTALTVDELSNAASSSHALRGNPGDLLTFLERALRGGGTDAQFSVPQSASTAGGRPWDRGRACATQLRTSMGQRGGPLSDSALEGLIGARFALAPAAAPIGLAIPSSGRKVSLHFRRTHPTGRRFEVARLIGAHTMASPAQWLVTSDAATANQKAQRAFAAEFLVPIEDLVESLGGDYGPDAIERAAEHYQVSPLTITSHLANNGFIPPEHVRLAI